MTVAAYRADLSSECRRYFRWLGISPHDVHLHEERLVATTHIRNARELVRSVLPCGDVRYRTEEVDNARAGCDDEPGAHRLAEYRG